MSIGEVAKIAEVNTSAIRHWEKEGLIFSERDNNNGYRMFSVNELRKVLIISSLRKSVYAIDKIRELLQYLDTQNFQGLDQSLSLALDNLDRKSTRLNSSHVAISYAVFCLKKKKQDYFTSPKLENSAFRKYTRFS